MAYVHRIYSEGGAIDNTMPALTTQRKLVGFTLHASAAPTTADVLYVTLKSGAGELFDTVLYSLTLSTGSTTDIIQSGDDFNVPLFVGDAVRVQYLNTDQRKYGIQLIME